MGCRCPDVLQRKLTSIARPGDLALPLLSFGTTQSGTPRNLCEKKGISGRARFLLSFALEKRDCRWLCGIFLAVPQPAREGKKIIFFKKKYQKEKKWKGMDSAISGLRPHTRLCLPGWMHRGNCGRSSEIASDLFPVSLNSAEYVQNTK